MAQLAGRTRSIGAERMALDAPASLARRGLFSARTGVGLDEQPRPAPEPRGAPQSRPQLGRATGTELGFGASQCVLENLGVRSDARPAAGTTPEFPQLQQCTASPASLPPRLAPRRASRRPAAPPRSTLGARRDGSAAPALRGLVDYEMQATPRVPRPPVPSGALSPAERGRQRDGCPTPLPCCAHCVE